MMGAPDTDDIVGRAFPGDARLGRPSGADRPRCTCADSTDPARRKDRARPAPRAQRARRTASTASPMPFASIMRDTTATLSGGLGGSGEGGKSRGSTPAPGTMVTGDLPASRPNSADPRCSQTYSGCPAPSAIARRCGATSRVRRPRKHCS
jgi:hypothetical protein